MKLTEKCLEHLGDRNIGLDGVVENEEKYQKAMKFKSSYSNLRYQGKGGGETPDGMVKVSEVPFGKLLEYDRRMFPALRPGFLKKNGSISLILMPSQLLKLEISKGTAL